MQIEILTSNINSLPRKLYTAQQTRDIDKLAIKVLYQGNGYELMKKAGDSLFRLASKQYADADEWLVFCGYGNNGGDGYVAARLAIQSGIKVRVIQAGDTETLSTTLHGEALLAYKALLNEDIIIESYEAYLDNQLGSSVNALIIDALLGTGLNGEVRGSYSEIIDHINSISAPVLAVDIPSGLCSNTGISLGKTVNADMTLSFIGINRGILTGQGRRFSGRIFFDALNLPSELVSSINSSTHLLSPFSLDLKPYKRLETDHKGSSGRAAFIGGSDGTSGAAIISCEAALRSGVGLLTALTGNNALLGLLTRCPEVMVRSYDGHEDWFQSKVKGLDAVAIGPGLGLSSHAKALLISTLNLKIPTVIDADALNIIAADQELWKKHGHEYCVFTPHPMEAARLLDVDISVIEGDRFSAVETLSKKFSVTTLLKGSGTLISDLRNNVFVCFSGNNSMAVGGMGDSLTGIILALLARSKDPLNAACFGAWAHSVAAEQLMPKGGVGLLPTDLNKKVSMVINETVAKRVL